MATKALNRFGFTLSLRVDDEHVYTVKSPPAALGQFIVELTNMLQQAEAFADQGKPIPDKLTDRLKRLTDEAPEGFDSPAALLGDAYAAMEADGMPYEVVKLAAATVGVWLHSDLETAEESWIESVTKSALPEAQKEIVALKNAHPDKRVMMIAEKGTMGVGSSRMSGVKPPTRSTCTPGLSAVPFTSGSVEMVAEDTMSAQPTAAL